MLWHPLKVYVYRLFSITASEFLDSQDDSEPRKESRPSWRNGDAPGGPPVP